MTEQQSTNPFEQQEWPLEPCAGDTHTDADGRLWTCSVIAYGARGGRWAFEAQGSNRVVVDTRQNLSSAHFKGMLAVPWDGLAKLGWVLGREWCQTVAEKLEPEPVDAVRFERLEQPTKED